MCGRYTLTSPTEAIVGLFRLSDRPNLPARYNIAPSQDVPAVRLGPDNAPALVLLRWGLVPAWAKEIAIGHRLINARAETVAEKPSFRAAFKQRRCLIPADGFYEWQKPPPGSKAGKQPYWIALADATPFAFAGLWESWRAPDGATIESCTIVTCPANELVAPIHARMPVIVGPHDHHQWLAAPPADAARLLKPYAAAAMTARPVSTRVNSPANDDADCIAALI